MNQKPSPEMIETARQQAMINVRVLALKHARTILGMRVPFLEKDAGQVLGVDQLVAEAKKVEAYITDELNAFKPKSGLVIQTQMPPPGAFKPGQ